MNFKILDRNGKLISMNQLNDEAINFWEQKGITVSSGHGEFASPSKFGLGNWRLSIESVVRGNLKPRDYIDEFERSNPWLYIEAVLISNIDEPVMDESTKAKLQLYRHWYEKGYQLKK